jgi:hypothetical protein
LIPPCWIFCEWVNRLLSRIINFLPVVALLFLAYLAGTLVVRFDLPPSGYLNESFAAAEALFVQQSGTENPWFVGAKPLEPEDLAAPQVRNTLIGVGRYDPELASEGLTIYTPIQSNHPLRLIDMQGNTVHQWDLPLGELAGERDDGLDLDPPVDRLTISYPRLLPDGSLIVTIGITGFTPWGYAVMKVDQNSNLIWKYTRQMHHDIDIDDEGRIYGLSHSLIRDPWPGMEYIKTPFIDDEVVVLTPDGKELQVISVLKAIENSAYVSLMMYANPEQPKGDLLHVNSVTWLDAAKAASLPNAEAGDLLISMRQIDVLAVLDPREEVIKWAWRSGQWRMQHDPDVLENGNLLVFDNRGDDRNGGKTRVVEVNPRTQERVWEYPGDSGEFLFTSIYGSQQRLPNGNTLISESNNGRILEVTMAGEVVWEYVIPERKTSYKGLEVATAVFAERYKRADLPFLSVQAGGTE